MPEAIFFSDAHVSDADRECAVLTETFLAEVCPGARRVYILGDLFDFWYGPRQATVPPYAGVLERIAALSDAGVAVTFYHGNRDFYVDEDLARRFRFRLVKDDSIEQVCGQRVLLSHGDTLCTNDIKYQYMRAVLRCRLTAAVAKRLPVWAAERLARGFRRQSKREVAAKSQLVLGVDDEAVERSFARGADVIVIGHTHREGTRRFAALGGERVLYTLGDFGTTGSYLACDRAGFAFKTFGR